MPKLLATKIHRPAPPARQVERPRLERLLTGGLAAGRPLTLVSAPAGFGKSTCISQWLAGLKRPSAWLSLDPSDDDPQRFFPYFLAALQTVEPGLGVELSAALDSGQLPAAEAFTAGLVEDLLAAGRGLTLVLDDFQHIQDALILEVLATLIANQPPQLHLVLVTREDPPLPLARLRANNLLTEVRASDLRFSSAESERFLNGLMGLGLAAGDLAALDQRTEGWIAGLQLAGLSIQGRPDPAAYIAGLSGSHRYILTYLTEEVLNRQPEDIQRFLLQTSILERLTGPLCDALTGRSGSAALLERLLAANLFLIALDDEQRWYRYHHLFAGLLRNLQSRLGAEELAGLHRRASQWYQAAGMSAEAMQHALDGGDFERAAALLEEYAPPLVMQGYARTVEGWMQALPPGWQNFGPRLLLSFAWMHLLRGSYDQVGLYLQRVEAALERAGPGSPQAASLRAEWLALRSNFSNITGQPAESIQLAEQALQAAQPGDQAVLGMAYQGLGGAYRLTGESDHMAEAYRKAIQHSRAAGVPVSEILAATALALTALQSGQLRMAAETGREVLERFEAAGSPPPISGTLYGVVGLVCYEWNQLEQAGQYFNRSHHLSGLVGHNAGLTFSQVILARLHQAGGDLGAAEQALQSAGGLLKRSGVPTWVPPEWAAQRVRLYLAQGNPAAAAALLDSLPDGGRPSAVLGLARLRLLVHLSLAAAGGSEREQALELAGGLVGQARARANLGLLLPALLLRAVCLAGGGQRPAALEDLYAALEAGEGQGFVRTFADEGPALAALLRAGLPGCPRPEYARRLLAAFPASAGGSAGAEGLAGALTQRELELLALMSEGLTYEQMAARLVVTVNTVRFHVKGVYGKLGVNNRTQALEAAREAGLEI